MYYSSDGTTWTRAGDSFKTAFAADANNNSFATAPGVTVAVTDQVLTVAIPSGANFYLAWNYSVTAGTTVTNAQALAVDDISILGIQSSDPAAVGSASPSPVQAGGATQLSATVTPGSNPASTGLAVSCDLTAVGGSSMFSLPNSNGNVYSANYAVPPNTPAQNYSLPCAVADDQGRIGTFTSPSRSRCRSCAKDRSRPPPRFTRFRDQAPSVQWPDKQWKSKASSSEASERRRGSTASTCRSLT